MPTGWAVDLQAPGCHIGLVERDIARD
jgi:hypothetical protein